MLTRGQVAKRIGRSIATVRRMEGHQLHPVRDDRGVLQFRPEEVERVLRRPKVPARRSPWLDGVTAERATEFDDEAAAAQPEGARMDHDPMRSEVGRAVRDELARRHRKQDKRRLEQEAVERLGVARERAQLEAARGELAAFVDECSDKERRRLFSDPEFLAIYDVLLDGE